MLSVSKLLSQTVRSEGAIASDYLANKQERLIGKHDRRLISLKSGTIPVLNSSSTTDVEFELPRFGSQFYQSVKLWSEINPITATGGTFVRAVNGVGIFMVEYFEVEHSGKILGRYYSDQMFNRYIQDNNTDEYTLLANGVGLDLTSGQRNTAAGSAQQFSLDLDEVCSFFNKPFPRHLLNGSDFLLRFRLRAISDIVETDGANPVFTFSNFKLHMTLIESNPLIDKALMVQSTKDFGIAFHQYESVLVNKSVVAAGNTDVDLSVLKDKEVVSITFFCRVAQTNADKMWTTFSNAVQSWYLEDANKYVHGAEYIVDKNLYRKILLPNYEIQGAEKLLSTDVYVISFSDSLAQQFGEGGMVYSGSKHFDTNTVRLRINFNPVFTGTVYVLINRIRPTFLKEGVLNASWN